MDALNQPLPSPSWPTCSGRTRRLPATTSRTASATAHDTAENDELKRLVNAVAAGDRQSLESLYARTVTRVYPLALRITQSRETAEEVVEDVYVQAWQTAQRFDPLRGSAWAWLLMICRSRSLDARRRMDPAILLADPWESLDAGTEEADNPQGFLEATQDRSALHQALARLSASQRQLVGLAFIRGLTHSEISRQLKLPLGTVKSQMRQALGDLRRGLGGR